MGRDRDKPDPNEAFRTLLRFYEFGHMTILMLSFLMRSNAASNRNDLKREAEKKQKELSLSDKHTSFSNAWEDYHGSFDADQDAVLGQNVCLGKDGLRCNNSY